MSESIGETERPENEVPSETTTASEHVEEENPAAGTSEAEEKDAPLAGSDGEQQQEEADTEPPEPPKKKSKTSRGGKKGKAVEINIDPDDKYPYARLRGIRIFSDREIEAQDAQMTREYWRFWNDTAEELCSNRAYNDWGKRDLKLYIDAAWIIHKTYLQENVERELAESLKELQEKCGYNELPHKLKNQDESVTTCLSKVRIKVVNNC